MASTEMEPHPFIVGHTKPDHDCALSLWLLQRYGGMAGADIILVDASEPDTYFLSHAAAVVDVGGGVFDHHMAGASPDTCAARLVADALREQGADIDHLEPLIDLVTALDTGRITREATASDCNGIHAALRGVSRSGAYTDSQLVDFCFAIYDGLDADLRARKVARETLQEHMFYTGMGGMLVAVRGGDRTIAETAGILGAEVTLFSYSFPVYGEDGEPCRTSYACAIRRTDRRAEKPRIGRLVAYAKGILHDDFLEAFNGGYYTKAKALSDCLEELNRWFIHPQGFYAGRGIEASPCCDPVECDLNVLAEYIERAWKEKNKDMPALHKRVLSFARSSRLYPAYQAAS